MYAFANQPVQFLHVRLVRKHLQVLADNIFVIPHGRPRLRKTRFEFMHLTGGLVYQRAASLQKEARISSTTRLQGHTYDW